MLRSSYIYNSEKHLPVLGREGYLLSRLPRPHYFHVVLKQKNSGQRENKGYPRMHLLEAGSNSGTHHNHFLKYLINVPLCILVDIIFC